jgi:hypothetical protein
VAVIIPIIAIKRVSINKMDHNKTLHLVVEINQVLLECLVDNGMSMSIMVISVVEKLGIMHLVLGHKTFKTPSRMVT